MNYKLLLFFIVYITLSISQSVVPKYDYIIIGGGSAGCVLATRLSENPTTTVLVLEAGDDETGNPIENVGSYPNQTPLSRNFYSNEGQYVGYRHFPVTSPIVLGGGSSVNSAGWTRGNSAIFDQWAAAGNTGWNYSLLLPFFEKVENFTGPSNFTDRGRSGLIPVVYPNQTTEGLQIQNLAQNIFSLPYLQDGNGPQQEGVSLGQNNFIPPNIRQGSYQTYLKPVSNRTNLTILQRATVLQIKTSFGIANLVTYLQKGQCYSAYANQEIILSAGPILSAYTLLNSGIGPAQNLSQLNITVISNLTGVGKNFRNQALILIFAASGNVSSKSPNIFTFYRSSNNLTVPDMQWIGSVSPNPSGGSTVGFFLGQMLNDSGVSGGYVRLNSNDPLDPPILSINIYPDPSYIQPMIDSFKLTRKLIANLTFGGVPTFEFSPGFSVVPQNATDAQISAWIGNNVGTYAHWQGSCKMGPSSDPLAVVDPRLRVYGVSRLRVCDTSIFPTVINTGPHWAVLATAEKASSMILEDNGNVTCATATIVGYNVYSTGSNIGFTLTTVSNLHLTSLQFIINFLSPSVTISSPGQLILVKSSNGAFQYNVPVGNGKSITFYLTTVGVSNFTYEFNSLQVSAGSKCKNL